MLPRAVVFPISNMNIGFEGIHLNLMRFSKISDENTWSIPIHAHENYEFHYIYSGNGIVRLGDKTFAVCKNQFYVSPPYVEHSQETDSRNPMMEYCIECKIDFDIKKKESEYESDYFGQLTNRFLYECHTDDKYNFLAKFKELDAILDRKGKVLFKGENTYLKLSFITIIIQSLLLIKSKSAEIIEPKQDNINRQRARSILNYLDANLKGDISISDCARTFCMSERQIDRIINTEYGCTFYQYLMKLRVNVAIELIRNTNDSMEEIAEKSGFSSYRQMLRNFNKFNIKNPLQIRKEGQREGNTERTYLHEKHEFDNKYTLG